MPGRGSPQLTIAGAPRLNRRRSFPGQHPGEGVTACLKEAYGNLWIRPAMMGVGLRDRHRAASR